MRVCAESGCPELLPKGRTRCATHARALDHARGSRQARGYDKTHDQLRQNWSPKVMTGAVRCWRCGKPLDPNEPWDLGHDDLDRSIYKGPEHVACNRAVNASDRP